jgi:hypothetical protein
MIVEFLTSRNRHVNEVIYLPKLRACLGVCLRSLKVSLIPKKSFEKEKRKKEKVSIR